MAQYVWPVQRHLSMLLSANRLLLGLIHAKAPMDNGWEHRLAKRMLPDLLCLRKLLFRWIMFTSNFPAWRKSLPWCFQRISWCKNLLFLLLGILDFSFSHIRRFLLQPPSFHRRMGGISLAWWAPHCLELHVDTLALFQNLDALCFGYGPFLNRDQLAAFNIIVGLQQPKRLKIMAVLVQYVQRLSMFGVEISFWTSNAFE